MHATYTGYKPPSVDVENLLLYNIGSSCFRPGTRHGVRFELGHSPWPDPPSGQHFTCHYQYRLIDPDIDLSHWRPVRRLADFTGADLGKFPSARRLEQVAASTAQPADLITQTLLDDRRAVLGVTDKLLFPRGDGVQWNPSDQLCMAGQVLVRPVPSTTWTLAGQIHAVEIAH